MVDELLGLGDARVLEVSLCFANEEDPLVFVRGKDLCKHVDCEQSHIQRLFVRIGSQGVCKGVEGLAHRRVLSLAVFEAAGEVDRLVSAPVARVMLERNNQVERGLSRWDGRSWLRWSCFDRRGGNGFDFLDLSHCFT